MSDENRCNMGIFVLCIAYSAINRFQMPYSMMSRRRGFEFGTERNGSPMLKMIQSGRARGEGPPYPIFEAKQ